MTMRKEIPAEDRRFGPEWLTARAEEARKALALIPREMLSPAAKMLLDTPILDPTDTTVTARSWQDWDRQEQVIYLEVRIPVTELTTMTKEALRNRMLDFFFKGLDSVPLRMETQ